jgi:hypothetical protein
VLADQPAYPQRDERESLVAGPGKFDEVNSLKGMKHTMAVAELDWIDPGLCKGIEGGPAKSLSPGKKYRVTDKPVQV